MKARELVAIGFKVLGVYTFFTFLELLPAGFGLFQVSKNLGEPGGFQGWLRFYAIYGAFVAFTYLAVSVGTFLGAQRLARFFVRNEEEQVALSGNVSGDVRTLAFQCLGVYAIVTWTPSLVQTLCRTAIYESWQAPTMPFLKRFYVNGSGLISPAIGTLVGLLLIFKARGLLRLIQISRPMSRERAEIEADGRP